MKSGDRLDSLLARLRKRLKRMVHGGLDDQLRGKVDESGLIQESLFKTFLAGARIDGTGDEAWGAFAGRVLSNDLKDAHRRKAFKAQVSYQEASTATGSAGTHAPPDSAPSPESAVNTMEVQAQVRRALAELPERQRSAVLLHLGMGLPLEEIGHRLGCSRHAAWRLSFKAQRSLRPLLRRLGLVP